MKLAQLGLMLLVAGTIAPDAGRGEAQTEARERFVCTVAGTPRYIDIYRSASRGPRAGGCRVEYTKNGVTRRIWAASGDYVYCVKRALALVTKLSRDHYSCKPESAEPIS